MKFKGLTFLLLSFFIACNSESPEPIGAFDQGILVLNEGNFGSGNGSLSFINEQGEASQQVFANANNGLALGDVVQSITETEAFFLIVVNNSNLLYALNKQDLSIAYVIESLQLPRYVVAAGSIGYITEWVSFTDPGRVTSFDLTTGQILNQQTTGYGAEYPFLIDQLLYVSNNFEATLTIMDATTLEVVQTLNTAPSPGQILQTEQDELWMICAGGYDENFAPANNGALQKIANNSIVETLPLGQNVAGRFTSYDQSLYYYSGTTVWQFNTSGEQINEYLSDTTATGFYAIAFDPQGQLYMTDNKGFQGAGEVIRYTSGGLRDAVYQVGIGPNALLIRK